MTYYDICIVGSGPSGMVAGVHAVKHNYRTLIIEQGPTIDPSSPRFEATPSNGIMKIVDTMKLPFESLSYRSMWVSPDGHRYLYSTNVPDLIFRRGNMPGALCDVLKEKFLDGGGEIMFNEKIEEVDITGALARSLNGGATDVTFDKLIWAAGETVPSLEKFCLTPSVTRTMHGIGTMFESEGVPDRCTIFLNPRFSPGGYLYEITSGGRTSVYNVTVDGNPGQLVQATKNYLAARGIEGSTLSYGHSHISPSGKRCIAGNVLLTGDAGALNDYGLGYGVRSAILSGYHAADSIVRNYDYYVMTKKRLKDVLMGKLIRKCLDRFDASDWDSLIGLADNCTSCGDDVGWRTRWRQVAGLCRAAGRLL